MKDKKIGVLMGGVSAERKISLKTGEAVLRALNRLGYQAVGIDAVSTGTIPATLLEKGIEAAFIALHGRYGEDGTIQGLLEIMGIPYTGSGVAASAVAMNKIMAKRLFRSQRIPTPPCRVLPINEDIGLNLFSFLQPLEQAGTVKLSGSRTKLNTGAGEAVAVLEGPRCKCSNKELLTGEFPVVVKPPSEGSTIGVRVVYDEDGLIEAIEGVKAYSSHVLIERFIDGSEVTVGLIEGGLLPTIEIVPQKGLYDYQSKYTPGMTDYILPASLDEKTDMNVQGLALEAYHALGCRGSVRVDMIVDRDRNPWVLEVNTIPGMTETSLLPRSAQSIGIPFDNLVEKILLGARLGE